MSDSGDFFFLTVLLRDKDTAELGVCGVPRKEITGKDLPGWPGSAHSNLPGRHLHS